MLTALMHTAGMDQVRYAMRWWYVLLLALPMVIGGNNARAGGEFLPVFIAGLVFALTAISSMEAAVLTLRLLRRQRAGAPVLDGLSHNAA
jgi:hypothetical protein